MKKNLLVDKQNLTGKGGIKNRGSNNQARPKHQQRKDLKCAGEQKNNNQMCRDKIISTY